MLLLCSAPHPCLTLSFKWNYEDVIWRARQKGNEIICTKIQWKDFTAFCSFYFSSDRSISFPAFIGRWPRAA